MPDFTNYNEWAQARQEAQRRGEAFNYDAPLRGVDSQKYKYASFIYPMDLGVPGSGKDHYVVFHINETSRTQFLTRSASGNFYVGPDGASAPDPALQNTLPVGLRNAQVNNAAGLGGEQPVNNGQGQGGGQVAQGPYAAIKQPIRRVATTIVLYMPEDIQVNYSAEWEATELGVAKEFTDLLRGTASWSDIGKSAQASAFKGLGQLANEFTGLNLQDSLSRASRLVINNHREVIFNGIGFRPFTFKFRFTPETEEEALNVDNIIRAFKFYAAPEILKDTAGRFWIYPAEFDIEYYANGKPNEFLNKISTCALTDMNVNYTAAGEWSAHRQHSVLSGAPSVCTEITLTFKELEIMTKNRILEGY